MKMNDCDPLMMDSRFAPQLFTIGYGGWAHDAFAHLSSI